MASAKKKNDCSYDWDDFDVGNVLANNSQGFFQSICDKQEALKRVQRYIRKEEYHINTREPEITVGKRNNILKDAKQFEYSKKPTKDVPKAYSFMEIYEKRKLLALQKVQEEERQLREFRSRPMPNFKVPQKQNIQRPFTNHFVTYAITPNTLKISQALEVKRKEQMEKKQQQQELELKMEYKSKVRTLAYLHEQPFVPKKSKSNLETKPFIFCTEERAEKRKIFNKHIKEIAEERKLNAVRQRVQQLEEEIKNQRLLTDFKARPNPFRKYSSVENVTQKMIIFN